MASRQLPLAFPHKPDFARSRFVTSQSNAQAVSIVERWPEWPTRALVLVGPPGGGKSHLGAIWCARTGAGTISASQLDDVDVPKLISGGVLLVEDLEGLSAKGERSLFHLLNITQQQRHSMLLTASSPPSRLDIGLADLASRLNALYSVTIGLPDDALLRALILKHLKDRQIALPKDKDGEVGDQILEYMVRRMERSAAGAARLVEALDAEALAQRRPITRALAAKVLDAFDAQDPDDGSAGTA